MRWVDCPSGAANEGNAVGLVKDRRSALTFRRFSRAVIFLGHQRVARCAWALARKLGLARADAMQYQCRSALPRAATGLWRIRSNRTGVLRLGARVRNPPRAVWASQARRRYHEPAAGDDPPLARGHDKRQPAQRNAFRVARKNPPLRRSSTTSERIGRLKLAGHALNSRICQQRNRPKSLPCAALPYCA